MSIENLNAGDGDSIKFLEGHELRTALVLLPTYAKKSVYIMVPYIGQGQLLTSILNIPITINVKMFTRDKTGYLPSIKTLADPTLDELKLKRNVQVYIDNKIHAKIWLVEEIAIVHSMNGTFHSEHHNFEAGIMTTDKRTINEIYNYFIRAEKEAVKLQ
ncbi:MAG: phospholipase D-like domain-containing protein [Candidatus Thorarchaeota archaeon]